MDGSHFDTRYPVVQRFEGIGPENLAGYEKHRKRVGGDVGHILKDPPAENRLLIGSGDWAAKALAEIAEIKAENFAAELEALEKRNRKKDIQRRMTYAELPFEVQRRFNDYTLKIYEIVGAEPMEAPEMFYRLNQPTALTAGEQRNALHGIRRSQMQEIVDFMIDTGFSAETIGFSNSRLSYDDVVARTMATLESGTLRKKMSEDSISDVLRNQESFPFEIYEPVKRAVRLISGIKDNIPLSYNKSSLFSMILFIARSEVKERSALDGVLLKLSKSRLGSPIDTQLPLDSYRHLFHDRAASRVTDVSSVLIRDSCIFRFCAEAGCDFKMSQREANILNSNTFHDTLLYRDPVTVLKILYSSLWGDMI